MTGPGQDEKDETPSIPVVATNGGQTAQDFLNGWMYTAMACTVRGAVASLPGFKPDAVVIAACRMLGTLVGTIFHGTLTSVLTSRKQCREAFIEALQKAPPPPMAPAQQPGIPMTPPFPMQGKPNGKHS